MALLFGFLCARFPGIAVFLVSGAAFTFGIFYTMIVYKIQKAKKSAQTSGGYSYNATANTWSNQQGGTEQVFGSTNTNEPNFRNVTTFMFREGRWIRDNNRQ